MGILDTIGTIGAIIIGVYSGGMLFILVTGIAINSTEIAHKIGRRFGGFSSLQNPNSML